MNPETTIRKNVGPWGRVVRVAFGLFLIWLAAEAGLHPWLAAVVAAFGGGSVLEGIIGY